MDLKCLKCAKTFSNKGNLKKHGERKTPCGSIKTLPTPKLKKETTKPKKETKKETKKERKEQETNQKKKTYSRCRRCRFQDI